VCVFGFVTNALFDLFFNIGSSSAELWFNATIGMGAAAYGLFGIFFSWQVFKLFKKIGAVTDKSLHEVGKRQIKLTKVFSVMMILIAFCMIMTLLCAVENVFKIWLSIFIFAAVGIGLPLSGLIMLIGFALYS